MSILATLQQHGDPVTLLGEISGLAVYPRSLTEDGDTLFFLGRQWAGRARGLKYLGLLTSASTSEGFELITPTNAQAGLEWGEQRLALRFGATHHANAEALRARLPFTAPRCVGVAKSAGLGDRLGLATPGHIRAMRHTQGITPVFAQQSIREMERTARTPEEVIDAATWGVFQEGWHGGYGADADHLKNERDIDRCIVAGFLWFTLDPRDHVDNDADTDGPEVLHTKYATLPWARLETTPTALRDAYLGATWTLPDGESLSLSETQWMRAACKYGNAIAHLASLCRYLERAMGGRAYEIEISVDETDTPTRPEEHFFIAHELQRLGARWTSLASRYVGRFEKGVDYIGDANAFAADFRRHVAVARALGPYKLSLHSGSDKFSIYPSVARLAGNLVHLKTAGTSYLEALRAVARANPSLFRGILRFALAYYAQDRASYHVSADPSRVPAPDAIPDDRLGELLDHFDARQALHVTFGTVLTAQDDRAQYLFRDRLLGVLAADEETHYTMLETHLARHLVPFSD